MRQKSPWQRLREMRKFPIPSIQLRDYFQGLYYMPRPRLRGLGQQWVGRREVFLCLERLPVCKHHTRLMHSRPGQSPAHSRCSMADMEKRPSVHIHTHPQSIFLPDLLGGLPHRRGSDMMTSSTWP